MPSGRMQTEHEAYLKHCQLARHKEGWNPGCTLLSGQCCLCCDQRSSRLILIPGCSQVVPGPVRMIHSRMILGCFQIAGLILTVLPAQLLMLAC